MELSKQLFAMSARAYYSMGNLDAGALDAAEGDDPLSLTLATEPYGTRIGVENLMFGPVSLAATGMMSVPGYQPLFGNAFPSQIEAEYPGQTFGGRLYPASGYSLSVSVPPYGSLFCAQKNRRFLYHHYDEATGNSILFTTKNFVGDQFRPVLAPSQLTPGVPFLNRVDVLELETVTEGLEPDGFTVTDLITLPELLRSQVIATACRSNTTDLWFLKSTFPLEHVDLPGFITHGLVGFSGPVVGRSPLCDAATEFQWGYDVAPLFNDGADYYLPLNPRLTIGGVGGRRLNIRGGGKDERFRRTGPSGIARRARTVRSSRSGDCVVQPIVRLRRSRLNGSQEHLARLPVRVYEVYPLVCPECRSPYESVHALQNCSASRSSRILTRSSTSFGTSSRSVVHRPGWTSPL